MTPPTTELEWAVRNFSNSDRARETGLFGVSMTGISYGDLQKHDGGRLCITLDRDGFVVKAELLPRG